MSISKHNPVAWLCPVTNKAFTKRSQAENYSAKNCIELVPLYLPPAMPFLERLQELIDEGASIKKQDSMYWLFDQNNEKICCGKTVRELMVNLIFAIC